MFAHAIRRTLHTASFAAALGVVGLAGGSSAQQAPAGGRVTCEALENGAAALGTASVRIGAREIATGACGTPIAVPAGSYTVVVRLDGALDKPEQTSSVTVAAGATQHVRANFATAIIDVRIEAQGRRAAGLAKIFRDGEEIGTLGNGVSAHVSAGTYDIVVRYRTQEQRFDAIQLAPSERRTLSATF